MAYHHGDARAALLTAATALLEREGATDLSLRQVAERAGLSRQAPYNHFAGKEALLAELAADGFRTLSVRLADAGTASAPVDRLTRAADAYIGFAVERPSIFRLMFTRALLDSDRHPVVRAEADRAMAQLSAVVAQVVPAAQVADATLTAWCVVHGYAGLCIEAGIEGPALLTRRAALFARAVAGLA